MKTTRTIFILALLALIAWAGIGKWKGLPPFGPRPQPAEPVAQAIGKPFPEKASFLVLRRALSRLCGEYGMDQAAILQELENLGIHAEPEWSIKRIAAENNMQPHSVFDTIRQLKD